MKASYGTILVLVMAMAVVPAGSRAWSAEEQVQEDIWLEYESRRGPGRWQELTDESINRIMEHLAEVNPAKAAELAKLRDKDPEEFKDELRKTIREEFRQRPGEQRGQTPGRRGGLFCWRASRPLGSVSPKKGVVKCTKRMTILTTKFGDDGRRSITGQLSTIGQQ